MPPTPLNKLSGLQREILSLYRLTLRAAKTKDCLPYAKTEFRKQSALVSRRDYKKVEYCLRKGHKHVKLLKMPGVTVVQGS
jgi:succinate dehydrogenase assembly factor 1